MGKFRPNQQKRNFKPGSVTTEILGKLDFGVFNGGRSFFNITGTQSGLYPLVNGGSHLPVTPVTQTQFMIKCANDQLPVFRIIIGCLYPSGHDTCKIVIP